MQQPPPPNAGGFRPPPPPPIPPPPNSFGPSGMPPPPPPGLDPSGPRMLGMPLLDGGPPGVPGLSGAPRPASNVRPPPLMAPPPPPIPPQTSAPPMGQPGVQPSTMGQPGIPPPPIGQPGLPSSPMAQSGVPPPVGQSGIPPSVVGQSGVPPPPLGQPGIPPSAIGQPGMPPSAIGQPGIPPSTIGQSGIPPSAIGQPGVPPSAIGQPAMPPSTIGQPVVPPPAISQPGGPASQITQPGVPPPPPAGGQPSPPNLMAAPLPPNFNASGPQGTASAPSSATPVTRETPMPGATSSVPPLMSLQVSEPSLADEKQLEAVVMSGEKTGDEASAGAAGAGPSASAAATSRNEESGSQSDGVYTTAREQLSAPGASSRVGLADKLPQALEKVLAFKDRRAQELWSAPANTAANRASAAAAAAAAAALDDEEEEEEEATRPAEDEHARRKRREKNKKMKEKKKRAKDRKRTGKMQNGHATAVEVAKKRDISDDEGVDVEYVSEDPPEEIQQNPHFRSFRKIFELFTITEADNRAREAAAAGQGEAGQQEGSGLNANVSSLPRNIDDLPMKARAGFLVEENERDFGVGDADDEEETPKLSKKRMKKLTRLSVAELKQLVNRPDVVEMHDVCARDPKLLISLKSYRNSVPVPRHWCAKRKYLQGKRGLEKPPFDLPDFIKATGIMEMRQAVQEKEAEKSLKNKMREKVRPKTGKIDIDYQKLHDAFFRNSTKPRMTIHGDLYYEGKEFEVKLKEKKPGQLTEELRTALGMPIGGNADRFPPPWLIAMQRYGPPPSYPNLKIPGLNAPIPDGCSFGYHAGGWGKPPVDEDGRPLYGDVFGSVLGDADDVGAEGDTAEGVFGPGEKHWGELESEEEESSEEEEEESGSEAEGDEGAEAAASGLVTPAEGLVTPSGVSSVGGITSTVVGLETPELIELRKRTIEEAMEGGSETPQLYKILPEVEVSVGEAFMGSSKVYEMPGAGGKAPGGRKRKAEEGGTSESGRASGASGVERAGAERDRSAKKYKEFKF